MLNRLADRWHSFIGLLTASSEAANVYSLITDSYGQYFRYYHTLNHLDDCFKQFEAIKPELNHPALLEYALWFHDIVCIPNSRSNETLSAAAAAYMASILDLPVDFGNKAADLIILTSHNGLTGCQDGAYLLDIDLAVLGREWEGFLEYEGQIRSEYSHINQAQYAQGRKKVLGQFLSRPAIYQTDYFREKYERTARGNLTRLNDLLQT